jgi:hypothetical protein
MVFAILPTHLSEILPTTVVFFLQQSIPTRAPRAIYNQKKQRAFLHIAYFNYTPSGIISH